ncbi:MAG: HEAT repeat domain-containing protein [Pirellulales bacterium]
MTSDEDVQAQIVALSSVDAGRSAVAAESFAHVGVAAQPAAVALVRACGSQDATVRAWAAAALEELGPPPLEQIGELAQMVHDTPRDVAYWAITLLGRAGQDAALAVPSLTKILRHSPHAALRERAAWALGSIGQRAAAAVPALHEAAAGDQPRLARLAKAALQAITG